MACKEEELLSAGINPVDIAENQTKDDMVAEDSSEAKPLNTTKSSDSVCEEQERLGESLAGLTENTVAADDSSSEAKSFNTKTSDNVCEEQERLGESLAGLTDVDSSATKPLNTTQPSDNVCDEKTRRGDSGPAGLTKRQLRKLMKREMWAKKKEQRIELRREKRQERSKRKQQAGAAGKGSGEEAQQSEFFPRKKKKKMSDPDASDVRIAIDCGFDDLMQEADITKLSKQIQRSYASNRTSDKPFQFYICNFRDKTKARFEHALSEYPKWDVHFREQGVNELFGKESVVYLTSESPQVLTTLDPEKVYVIGGLVDHNHHKGVCYEQAVSQGWAHAQLPIAEYMKFKARKVLTVNHVYEILVAFMETEDWKAAFDRVIPQRKFHIMSRRERRQMKAQLKDSEKDDGNNEVAEMDSADGDEGDNGQEVVHDGSQGQGSSNELAADSGNQNGSHIKDYDGSKKDNFQDVSKIDDSEATIHRKDELEPTTSRSIDTILPPQVPADMSL
ncbi:uncharacterized protein [Amphiura filiformis]|uniref:uncharacterized protein n=1 Tax=Amphiura filiformis TaxID=82378 RepID=UPI003B2212F5